MRNSGFTPSLGIDEVASRPSANPLVDAGALDKWLGQSVDDMAIEVVFSYWLDAVLPARSAQVEVRAERGVLHVTGIVDTRRLCDRLERLAWTTAGVADVVLNIDSLDQLPDAGWVADELAHQVASDLCVTRSLELSRVRIQVRDGTVVLSGSTRSLADKLLAGCVALESARIHRVVNNLCVFGELPN